MHREHRAEALVARDLATLRDEILPTLSGDKRYAGSMMANALEIALRDMQGESDAAEWALLDPIYGEGEGSMARLAGDIRSGAVSEASHAKLVENLRRHVVAELKVRNPRFLKSRGVTG